MCGRGGGARLVLVEVEALPLLVVVLCAGVLAVARVLDGALDGAVTLRAADLRRNVAAVFEKG